MSNEAPSPPRPTDPAPAAAPTAPPPPERPRKRRWFLRLFVLGMVLLLLVGGGLVAVQWALQNTDYARRIALPIVERQLGLRLHARSLRVSLLGHTELTDVDVGLPLDKADFLHVPALKVTHANLLEIIFDRAVTLDRVEIDRPTVDVVQDANGQWNLLQVVDILGRLGGSNNAQPTATSGGVPKLPAVRLVDGTVNLSDNKRHAARVYPLNVTGEPQDLLVWKYDLSAGPAAAQMLKVSGVVAPGGSWTHEVTAAVGNLDPLAHAFGVKTTFAANATATWDGQLSGGKVAGRLTLKHVSAAGVPSLGDVAVTGAVDVTTGGTAPAVPSVAGATATPVPLVTLLPNNLQLATSSATLPLVGVRSGSIVYDAAGLHARGVAVAALGGVASLDATADPKTQNVDLSAHWNGLTLAAGISQAGSLTASFRQPFPGQPLVKVELDDRGDVGGTLTTSAAAASDLPATAGTKWDAAVQVTGQGTTFTSIDWVLAVPRLTVARGGKDYDLSGLTAEVRQRPTTIDLLGLTLPASAAATSTTTVAAAGPAATAGGGSRSATSTPSAVAAGSPFGMTFSSSAHLTLPDATLNPPRPLSWKASVHGGLTASYQGTPVPVTLAVEADGDAGLYTLRRFAVSAADATVLADGTYDVTNPKPVVLHVALTQRPRLSLDAPVQGTFGGDFKVVGLLFDTDPAADAAEAALAAAQPTTQATTRAATQAGTRSATQASTQAAALATTTPAVVTAPPTTTLSLASTTAPTTAPVVVRHRRFRPYLTTTGDLKTAELVVFGKPIGDIDIKVAGDVQTPHPPKTENGPAAADAPPTPPQVRGELHSTDFFLFQAPWQLNVDYPNADGAAELNLSAARLPLDVLAKAATGSNTSPVMGQVASAHWRVTLAGLGLSGLDVTSEYHLTNVAAGGLTVDTVDAAASFHDRVVRLDPVVARSGTGVTRVSATYDLRLPKHVMTHVAVDRWPYPLASSPAIGGSTEARASSNIDVDVNLDRLGAAGTATAAVDVLLHPASVGGRSVLPTQRLAHAQLAADVRGRAVDLTDLSGEVLGGKFSGSAQVDLDKPLEAAGVVKWRDVDAGVLARVTGSPALQPADGEPGLDGKFSGAVTIVPSRDPRSLEPIRIDVNVSARDAHFRSVMIGEPGRILMGHAVAYANVDRAVLDHSDMYLAGGIVHLWGRVGRGLASQTLIVDFHGLNLDQLAHLAPAQTTGPVPGTVNGSLRVIRSGSALTALTGGGHADIVDADLVNLKAIRKLYDILQASAGGLQPVGRGGTDFDLEAGTVRVNSFRFYNRGIDASGLLSVGPYNQDDALATRIGGQVVGTERLFKGTRLPLFSDFDQTFTALQSNLTTINVSGTLGTPKIGQAAADEIGGQLRQLIVGDAQPSQ